MNSKSTSEASFIAGLAAKIEARGAAVGLAAKRGLIWGFLLNIIIGVHDK